ncbi:DUF3781 domain-containing protein [bacterium]|nr:DUF3781 domain-containing protein [bacterium]
MHDLISNIDRLHTTDMGGGRIVRNLNLAMDTDVITLCRDMILSPNACMKRRGKNYYVTSRGCIITINTMSFTVITAHPEKR